MIDPDYGDVVEAELQRTTYEYNKCGQVTTICDPLGNKTQYSYDTSGRVISEQDAEGYTTAFAYNQLGQIADVAYADGRKVAFRYGELRQLAEVQDWLGITKIETTASGQITKVTQPDGSTLGYEWNQLGQRSKTIYPDGIEVAYSFDRTGRLTEVQAPGGLTRYSYDEAGCLNRKEMPGKVSTDYSWNNLGMLTQMIHSQNGEVLDSYRYQYDPNGNITQIEKQRAGLEEDSGVFSYGYDGLNRLMSAAHGGQSKHYGYDSCGNRIIAYDGETETRYCYNARNQLIGLQDALSRKEYRYDQRGNLTDVLQNGSMEAQYSYDSANLMVKAISPQSGIEEYAYDGLCNRVSKNVHIQDPEALLKGSVQPPTEAIRYYVDYLKPYNNLLRTETNGSQSQNFVWGKDLLASEGDISYTYLQDHLGSAIRLVEDTAESTPLAYDEFGVPLVQAGKAQHNPFGFAGYQQSEVSGLQYAQARYYDPHTSRMAAEDSWLGAPRLPQSLNRYAFCLNNPVALVDRTGNNPALAMAVWGFVGPELVNSAAQGFSDFMASIPDETLNGAKDFLTPGIEAAHGFFEGIPEPVKDGTRWLIRNGVNQWGDIVGRDNLARWGASALDMAGEKDEHGNMIYHAAKGYWQIRFGYNDIYDDVFDLGTSMKTDDFKFECGGKEFVFWAWKGDYLNLGAGAELGIYWRDASLPYDERNAHWEAEEGLNMPMTMRLIGRDGEQIFGRYPEDPQTWITGFRPDQQLMDTEDLIAIYTISMSGDSQMFDAFFESQWSITEKRAEDQRLVLNPFAQMVTITFMPEDMENSCIS